MKTEHKRFKVFFSVFIFSVLFFYSKIVFGGVMTGSVYEMETDSLNFAGENSESELYSLLDSLGEISSGFSSGTLYSVDSGYQQDFEYFISLSLSDTRVALSPALGGISGGYSNSSSSIGVLTDNENGYALYIKSISSPTLYSSDDSFGDYSPSGDVPDIDFSVSQGDSRFGFSVFGSDVTSRYKNNGNSCGEGENSTEYKCWDGLSVSNVLISGSVSGNYPSTSTTTVFYRAGVGPSRMQKPGDYRATTTITVIAL